MIQDLVSDDLNHLKGLRRCDGIHEHVPMDPNEMLRVEDAVFILEFPSDLPFYIGERHLILPGQRYR